MGVASNGSVLLTVENTLERVASASGDSEYGYKLGAGGRNPKSARPYTTLGQVDCSGYLAWALGYDRLQPKDYWVYTDSIEADARSKRPKMFRVVRKAEQVLAGDVLVYGGRMVAGERKIGHTGIITEVRRGFVRGAEGWHKLLHVSHATPSHRRKYGNVIATTDARAWKLRGYIVRYLHHVSCT